nr:hypothetical protein [Tanacetum cinerariifolium]
MQRITQSFSPNLEISFPPLGDEDGTEGPMIIEAEIEGHFIHRIYVDGGSASEILYVICFNRLRPKVKNQMVLATAPLIGFSGEIIWPMGQILLPIKIVPEGILTLRSSKIIPLKCTMVSGLEAQTSDVKRATEEKIKVAIHPKYPEQTIAIGSTLTEEGRKAFGASPERPRRMPFGQTKEKKPRTKKEQVMVKKDDDSWRMCVDFKDQNKAYPKDGYPLLEIDWKNRGRHIPGIQGKYQRNKDFIVKRPKDDSLVTTTEAEEELPDPWTLFTDGSSCIDGSGASRILTNLEGTEFTYALRFRFDATNNEAEYEALLAGLRIAEQMERNSRITYSKIGVKSYAATSAFLRQTSTSQWLGGKSDKSLGEGIKVRMDERSKDWIEEIPHVLRAHCTMIKSSNEDMPFSLTYETKAVILAKIV